VPAPDQLTIDTPEQIVLEFPLAGVGSRFLALAIDTLIQAALIAVVAVIGLLILVPAIGLRGFVTWTAAILLTIVFVIYTGYFAVFEVLWNGQTPGKRQVGLRVIDASGRPITAYAAIIRNLLRLVDQLPGFYALAIVSVLVTERQQRLGDLAAGTVVVHDRVEPKAAAPRPATAARHGADRLTPEEIVLVEGFLRRREDLDPLVRLNTARQIAARMAARLGLAPVDPLHPLEDEERLLEQLAAEYRASGSYR
jgi:uncharacterized RDD family membrane protein YckC